MEINQRTVGDKVILDVSGAIDLHSSPELRTALIELIEQRPDGQPLFINLSAVRYIDSSGLATLIEGLQKGRGKSVNLVLFGLSGHVREVFHLVRLDKLFGVYEDEQTALQWMKGE